MTQPMVLAITLNWRQAETTLACVRALQAMAYPNLRILVIDNGSEDGSAARLAAELPPEARLLALPENLGFAAGNNVGLREAIAQAFDFALLVNNDAFAAPDMLARLLAETAPDVGLVSPKIFYAAARERIWFGDGRMHPITLDLRGTGRGQMDGPDWQHSRDADYVLGTCLLVNLQGVTAVGLLDEQFFMYFEDLDWSLRWRQAGFRLRLAADAHLYHEVALSSGGLESAARRYYLARSGVIFWRRYARLGRPWAIFLFRLGSGVKMVARLMWQRETAVARAYLRGLRDGWRASA
ncbi:MAG: glycosyltransferase family 2 protein [Chloroflexi bacterium]|nr:glycosyltransferase family 2 protein [Chloroflexota bacterium]